MKVSLRLGFFATFLKKGSAKNFPTGKILGYFSKIVRSTVVDFMPFTESLPLEGGGNPSEQKARDAVDGRSFLCGTINHYRHLIRHLSVTPSPTGEGNRKALFRQQIFNAFIGESLIYRKAPSARELARDATEGVRVQYKI